MKSLIRGNYLYMTGDEVRILRCHLFTLKNIRCFLKRQCLKGGHFDPSPTNSKTKDATRTKLCTVIVRQISTKNQQLDFSNFHYSIVCSYCSIWCLIIKSGSKMIKTSNASYETEIHMVDSPFSEDSKNIFFFTREALTSGEGRPEILGKMVKTGKPIVMQISEWSIQIGNTGLFSLVSKSLHYLCFPAC